MLTVIMLATRSSVDWGETDNQCWKYCRREDTGLSTEERIHGKYPTSQGLAEMVTKWADKSTPNADQSFHFVLDAH